MEDEMREMGKEITQGIAGMSKTWVLLRTSQSLKILKQRSNKF